MNEAQVTLPTEGFVRAKVLHKILGIGLNTLYDYIATGRFPKGTHISARVVVWNVNVVRSWIEEQK